MALIYKIVSVLLFILLLPALPFLPRIRSGFLLRTGLKKRPQGDGGAVWMHGASAGDLAAIQPMVEEMKARMPGRRIVLTTITNTGLIMGRKRFEGLADVDYAPFDIPFAVGRAVSAIRPAVVVLEYTEIWPNMIEAAKDAGAAVVLINGRFSAGRVALYKTFFRLIGNPLKNVDLFLMRDEVEAENAIRVGAEPERVRITGNTKFDALIKMAIGAEPPGLARDLWAGQGLMVVFGSIHEGEESMAVDAFVELRRQFPTLRALIAPRYPERARAILSEARDRKLAAMLRSLSNGKGSPPDVIVLDTIGELAQAYRYGELAFVGGSMTHRGGQNILEPAVHGKVVVFGPHIQNFQDCASLLVGRGGFMVNSGRNLVTVMRELLGRPQKLVELGEMARRRVMGISGATAKNLDMITALMDRRGLLTGPET
jgi:3-deoxy-D-manno-octulosonic-acid transferase